MSVIVHPDLWKRFPGMKILCVTGKGLNNQGENRKVEQLLAKAHDAVTPEQLEHQNVQAWREMYQIAGISMGKYPVSVLAMVKRIAKGGRVPSINPLVNFYNAISIANISPLGGMDLDQLTGHQELRFTQEGEDFLAIGAESAEKVQPGEICYSDERGITTRHFAWRQSLRGAIQPTTKNFVLFSEIVPGTVDGLLEKIQQELVDGLEKYFGVTASTEIIEEKILVPPAGIIS